MSSKLEAAIEYIVQNPLREIIPPHEYPQYAGRNGSDFNMWQYEGAIITERSLKDQRMVNLEPQGFWTRPKDRDSENSLEA